MKNGDTYCAIVPESSDFNAFVLLTMRAIECAGVDVVPFRKIARLGAGNARYALLNWYDEIVGGSALRLAIRYFKRKAMIRWMVLSGVSLIPVIHNKIPHDASDGISLLLSRSMRRFVCRNSFSIVILCDETRDVLRQQLGKNLYNKCEGRIRKVSHPSYLGYYRDCPPLLRGETDISDSDFVLLTTGLIRRYKGVELVLEAARRLSGSCPRAVFVIAGKCVDAGFLDELEKECDGMPNVRLVPRFIPDDIIVGYVNDADALLLPYDLSSSLNSGNCILAFSYARTVICPRIGTVAEYPMELTYTYTYSSPEEHVDALVASISHAYLHWIADPDGFRRRGERLAELTEEHSSIEKLSSVYADIFGCRR